MELSMKRGGVRRGVLAGLAAYMALCLPAALAADASREALDAWLHKVNGAESGQVSEISGSPVARMFPAYHFYSLRFRMYPVARMVPGPLGASNVLAVSPEGAV